MIQVLTKEDWRRKAVEHGAELTIVKSQLKIAIDCLELYSNKNCWRDCYIDYQPHHPPEIRPQGFFAMCGYNIAEKALELINKEKEK